MEAEYLKYQNMIAKKAWQWSNRTGWDFEDVMAEGNLVFCQSMATYNPALSAFSTYLFNSLQMHYGNMYNKMKVQKRSGFLTDFDDLKSSDGFNPEQQIIFQDMLEKLNDDAKVIINAILDAPEDLIKTARKPNGKYKLSRSILATYFKDCRGWAVNRIWNAFADIQDVLAT